MNSERLVFSKWVCKHFPFSAVAGYLKRPSPLLIYSQGMQLYFHYLLKLINCIESAQNKNCITTTLKLSIISNFPLSFSSPQIHQGREFRDGLSPCPLLRSVLIDDVLKCCWSVQEEVNCFLSLWCDIIKSIVVSNSKESYIIIIIIKRVIQVNQLWLVRKWPSYWLMCSWRAQEREHFPVTHSHVPFRCCC